MCDSYHIVDHVGIRHGSYLSSTHFQPCDHMGWAKLPFWACDTYHMLSHCRPCGHSIWFILSSRHCWPCGHMGWACDTYHMISHCRPCGHPTWFILSDSTHFRSCGHMGWAWLPFWACDTYHMWPRQTVHDDHLPMPRGNHVTNMYIIY